MTDTLTVPIGSNAHVDGGPFNEFRGLGEDGDVEDGTVQGVTATDDTERVDVSAIEEALEREMGDDQPFHLSTGDAGYGRRVGSIDVPLAEGYIVELHALDGQGKDTIARLENLRDDITRRRHFERGLVRHGGVITSL